MTDWTSVYIFFLGGVSTLLGYAVKLLWDIREHLTRLNGRVDTCGELRLAHELSDKDKHESCEGRILTIERTLIERRIAKRDA